MRETRAAKYGRNLAVLIGWMLDKSYPLTARYKRVFLLELQDYPIMPRRKGTPRNEGAVDELENVDTINPENPRHAAKVIKQGLHLMYQKNTSKNSLYALLENL